MKKFLAALLMAGFLLGTTVGCGGDDKGKAGKTGTGGTGGATGGTGGATGTKDKDKGTTP